MFFARVKTPGIAHIAYIIGDDGQAAVVDPRRDVDEYIEMLENNSLRLKYVLETHRQEDFEMGSASLRRLTGAEIVAAADEVTAHADVRLNDGDEIQIGNVRLRALRTPGHTPESICYAVFLADDPDHAWGVFTGDALFIGDTGRTDLIDENKTAENAECLYHGLHDKIFPLGDQALVLPAHGAGSACGGNVADRDESTLGIERQSNAVGVMNSTEFVKHKMSERNPRPPYFTLMENVNLEAGRPLDLRPVPWLRAEEFSQRSRDGIIVDTREAEAFAGGHIPDSYSVWLEGLPQYGGWIKDEDTPIYLVLERSSDLDEARLSLARIGRDKIAGVLAGGFTSWRSANMPIEMSGTLSAKQLSETLDQYTVLDVRAITEFEGGHIPGAKHRQVGDLESHLEKLQLDREARIAVICSVGHRGSLGVSILMRHGYRNVFNVLGGMSAWQLSPDAPLSTESP
ncbi:MAG: rhodanese-like domain-containing protein [Pseudohongiellaceae bacterium]